MVSAMGPEYQKYLWWKKHLTTVQLVGSHREYSLAIHPPFIVPHLILIVRKNVPACTQVPARLIRTVTR